VASPIVLLERLQLADFRNLERLELRWGPRFNVVAGRNGSGKTNIVEAIYLTGALRSFRTAASRDLVRHGANGASVTAVFGGVAAGLACEVRIAEDGRRVRVDGKPPRADGAHFRALPMVLFHPGHMELVQGGPEARRRFLDRALYQAERGYPAEHRAYLRALASRNRLLKARGRGGGAADDDALRAFAAELVAHGARVVAARARFVAALAPLFAEALAEVSGEAGGGVAYAPSARGEEELAARLAAGLAADLARGFTAAGPHADDLAFEVGGRDARRFASQGQQRTAVLAAKIAETRALAAATGRTPLMLLDDVSSELDEARNASLLAFLDGVGGQVIITTTHPKHVVVAGERIDFAVEGGAVRRLTG
jgi:DNA replication and repair protein RecF